MQRREFISAVGMAVGAAVGGRVLGGRYKAVPKSAVSPSTVHI